jgi:hypothetical protein
MTSLSITRLHLRSGRHVLPLVWHTFLTLRQARRAEGCLDAAITRYKGAFWTKTLWRDAAAMKAFMLSGAHRAAMPRLVEWCDEASAARIDATMDTLPTWPEAERLMAEHGWLSPVKFPSPAHAAGGKLGAIGALPLPQ